MRAEVTNLAAPGFIADQPDIGLAPAAWTDSRNVRYREGAAEKCKGYTQALGSLSVTAVWASPISDGTNYFWVYSSNTVLYATDGATHANVTGSTAPNATDDLGFTGGAFHGFMLMNDGVGVPQSWSPSLANDFTSLSAWPSITCKVLRPFKDFLFAFRITESGSLNPRLMRWSDRASTGSLPASWDFTDPTNQAGINELGQTGDSIVDALALRDSFIIYKENYTWTADYIGGDDIFGFRQVFSQVGMLTENCGLAFGAQHLVMTDHDVVLHDGSSAQSILDGRARRWLFSRINTSRYKRCYLVPDYRNREAHICFPEAGYDWPNLALVWNWHENTLNPMELGGPKTWATPGIISGTAVSFDADTGTFDGSTGTFDDETFSPFQNRILLLDALQNKAYQNDSGETFDGTPMQVYATRTGMAITKDLSNLKRVRQLLPKVIGTAGDILNFYIGTRTTEAGATQWRGPYPFVIGTDYKIDVRISARVLDLRVEYSGAHGFRFYGLGFEFDPDGMR